MAAITLQKQLNDAQQAYHELLVGRSARVVVDQNGERVEYAAANSAKLAAYIETLKTALGVGGNNKPGWIFL